VIPENIHTVYLYHWQVFRIQRAGEVL